MLIFDLNIKLDINLVQQKVDIQLSKDLMRFFIYSITRFKQ